MATNSVSGVGTISSAGVGSGLDVSAIVTQLMAVESRPLTLLKNRAESLQAELSTYGSMKSKYADLKDKANALLAPSLWNGTTATADDAASIGVSSTGGAQTGTYAITVSALAKGQTLTSTALVSAATPLSAGTLQIELGTWTGGTSFTPRSGAAPVGVSIAGSDSLATIRDKINAADAGVVATIVTDESGARLSLRSADTGAANGFRVTATETVDDGILGSGLSRLAYDPSAGVSAMTLAQSAGNASATINGIAVSSASNTLSDVVDGLTLTLQKLPAATVNVTVASDTASVRSAISAFVASFNGLASYIHSQTAYDPVTKTGGSLQGDQATLSLQSQLRAVVNQSSTAGSTWSRLSDIGITMAKDSTLEVKSSKLDSALGNLAELKKLLFTDGTTTAGSGFVRRFQRIATAALSFGGVFDSRTQGLNTSLALNGKQQDSMQTRLDATEARLRAQYTSLDTTMSRLSSLSSYITQQITLMNNKSSG